MLLQSLIFLTWMYTPEDQTKTTASGESRFRSRMRRSPGLDGDNINAFKMELRIASLFLILIQFPRIFTCSGGDTDRVIGVRETPNLG